MPDGYDFSNSKYQYKDKITKNNQMEIVELQNTTTEMKKKNLLEGLWCWFELAEERISNLKIIGSDYTIWRMEKERMKKNEQSLREMWDMIKHNSICAKKNKKPKKDWKK